MLYDVSVRLSVCPSVCDGSALAQVSNSDPNLLRIAVAVHASASTEGRDSRGYSPDTAPMPLTHPCRFRDMPLRPHLVGRVDGWGSVTEFGSWFGSCSVTVFETMVHNHMRYSSIEWCAKMVEPMTDILNGV